MAGTARGDVVLRGGHLPGGRRVDVVLRGGTVLAVPAAGAGDAAEEVDVEGHLLLPAPAEPHAHLDKALSAEAVGAPAGDLAAAVAAWGAHSAGLTGPDVAARATRAVAELVDHGATAVRTHVNIAGGARPLLPLQEVLALRDRLRPYVTLQVVLLPGRDTPDDLVREALACGADLLGGAPHLTGDQGSAHARLLRLASEADVGLDLHTDEQLDPGVRGLADLARRVLDTGFPHPVTASHCVSLGLQQGAELAETVELVRQAGICVVALPQTNLGLQGRGSATSPPRGLTAVRALLDAGVPVAAGSDNLRDPFNPVGRADPLEVAALLVSAGHLTVEQAWDAVGPTARRVLGLPPAGPEAGAAADLLAVRAGSLADAVARAPEDRVVIRAGQVVATSRVRRTGPFSALLA